MHTSPDEFEPAVQDISMVGNRELPPQTRNTGKNANNAMKRVTSGEGVSSSQHITPTRDLLPKPPAFKRSSIEVHKDKAAELSRQQNEILQQLNTVPIP